MPEQFGLEEVQDARQQRVMSDCYEWRVQSIDAAPSNLGIGGVMGGTLRLREPAALPRVVATSGMAKKTVIKIPKPSVPITEALKGLDGWITTLPRAGAVAVGGPGSPMFVFDWIVMAAVKRSLSLTSGMGAMVRAQNMVCARALLRMHLDTVSRFLGYTYVANLDAVAKAVIGGTQLKKFKSTDGKPLTDAYLVERMSQQYPWVKAVYESTSGYVHFSEKQFYDAVHRIGDDEERVMHLQISHVDEKYPEFSWAEVVACFNQLMEIFVGALKACGVSKQQFKPKQQSPV